MAHSDHAQAQRQAHALNADAAEEPDERDRPRRDAADGGHNDLQRDSRLPQARRPHGFLISDDQFHQIKAGPANGDSVADLARRLGLSRATVRSNAAEAEPPSVRREARLLAAVMALNAAADALTHHFSDEWGADGSDAAVAGALGWQWPALGPPIEIGRAHV